MGDFDCDKIRNICILAHVDHGKTTLADHLIARSSEGLLHPKQAGHLRFMDYLVEEQRRAITMKSSSIALRYKDYSINLIDSPGHMDFCSEVSTAARLSDGALILVDAVEGVHIQTHAVLRQSWIEKLTPCLVLNKIDRLICELKLSPMEAYIRLLNLVYEVNVIVGAYKSQKYLSDVDSLLERPSYEVGSENNEFMDADIEDTFEPQKGNVAFVCSLDGWGFRIRDFAEFYASKFGASMGNLEKAFWGPWYFNAKTKEIVRKKKAIGVNARPMFVQFVLEPIWKAYQASPDCGKNEGILEKIIKSFNLSIPARELRNRDPKSVLQAVMSSWLPLSETILSMVIKFMPNPSGAQSFRISRLLPKHEILNDGASSSVLDEAEIVRKSVEACDSSVDAPLIAFVSKMFAIPVKMLPQRASRLCISNGEDADEESGECFLAFARVFSGVISSGQKVFVLSELYDPVLSKNVHEVELQSLYLMMGQGLVPVGSVKAGNIVAIQGLGQNILKSATLSSTKNCWPFSGLSFQVSPTMRVSIQPSHLSDLGALRKGLKLLNRADPFVEVTISSKGEIVVAAAGEVHLERCIKDLEERFAKVSFEVSPPLVSFKETIEGGEPGSLHYLKMFLYGTEYIEKTTANGRCTVRVRVMKLPPSLVKVLDENSKHLGDIITAAAHNVDGRNSVEALKKKIEDALGIDFFPETDKDEAEHIWGQVLKRIWALGPKHVGSNILLAPDTEGVDTGGSLIVEPFPHASKRLGFLNDSIATSSKTDEADNLANSVVSGFQLATAAGPLCDEPMWGLAFLVEAYIDETQTQQDYGAFAGQVMGLVKDAIRAAVIERNPRLVEPMYFCELNTPNQYLGPMHAVLSRRRAQVLLEEREASNSLFTVKAYVPVAEGFGFADELRRWTAGTSSALLVFSHWRVLPEDPFFAPKTEKEVEEFGDGSSVRHNTPRKLIDAVRRRKGLPVEEKVVQHASKQRTLSRKV